MHTRTQVRTKVPRNKQDTTDSSYQLFRSLPEKPSSVCKYTQLMMRKARSAKGCKLGETSTSSSEHTKLTLVNETKRKFLVELGWPLAANRQNSDKVRLHV